MPEHVPHVSIGLPVYNGENFVSDALDSILAQTYTDFEVVISDNASTDQTEAICRGYAERDTRIRYTRLTENLGAAANFNQVFEMARGRYFRWAAHDDRTAPEFLEKCVHVLDTDSSVVLVHTKVRVFDGDWNAIEDYVYGPRTYDTRPAKRFYDLLFVPNRCYEVFGLIRVDALRDTGLMGNYPVGDRVLLSELAFRGRFCEVPEYLFHSCDHQQRSVRHFVTQQERAAWFDTRRYNGRITFPEWRTFAEYCKAIRRSPLQGQDRLYSNLYMLKWLRHYRKRMRHDLVVAAKQLLYRESELPHLFAIKRGGAISTSTRRQRQR